MVTNIEHCSLVKTLKDSKISIYSVGLLGCLVSPLEHNHTKVLFALLFYRPKTSRFQGDGTEGRLGKKGVCFFV